MPIFNLEETIYRLQRIKLKQSENYSLRWQQIPVQRPDQKILIKIHQYPVEIMCLLCFNQYFETYTLLLHNI